MDPITTGAGLSIGGLLIAAWNTVKTYYEKATGLFILRLEGSGSYMSDALNWYLANQCKKFENSSYTYVAHHVFVRPLKRSQIVGFKGLGNDVNFYWIKNKPAIVSRGSKESGGWKITMFKWTINPDELFAEIIDKYNDFNFSDNNPKEERDRFYVRRFSGDLGKVLSPSGEKTSKSEVSDEAEDSSRKNYPPLKWKPEELGPLKKAKPFNSLILSQDCLNALEEARMWKQSEKWYKDRSIPWKRGWLLHGDPGNGKTSFARALAQELNMPVMVFTLSNMTNDDFSNAWSKSLDNAPAIVLLEDIDSVFQNRKNMIDSKRGLSFDYFLNCVDGIEASDGIFLIVTTNHVDKVDPAIGQSSTSDMSSRPGRIDRSIFVDKPTQEAKKQIADRILSEYPKQIEQTVLDGINDSGAQFQERCARLALNLYWEEKKSNKEMCEFVEKELIKNHF